MYVVKICPDSHSSESILDRGLYGRFAGGNQHRQVHFCQVDNCTVFKICSTVAWDVIEKDLFAVSRELGVDYLDQVLLSVRIGPLQVEDERDDDFLPMILPLYEMLEELHDAEKVHGIGVSDLDKEKLQSLYEAVKVRIK